MGAEDLLSFEGGRRFQAGILGARGSKSTCPSGVAGKRAVVIGEQAVEAGLRGVEPYVRTLTGEGLGLEEPSCDIA